LANETNPHPFVQFIQKKQQEMGNKLDDVEHLQMAHAESISKDRLEWHVNRLHEHI